MKTKFTVLALLLCAGLSARAAQPTPSSVAFVSSKTPISSTRDAPRIAVWPQNQGDLKADANAVWGRLDNGLRYVILPTRGVPGRASLRLAMNVGSMMDPEDRQGVAHFLEHMAFNGTSHFPAGELVKYFQHLGMEFGPHANAYTSSDRTVYELELPRADIALVSDGLKVYRDFLDSMLLEPQEIDRERRVIFSEILARNTSNYRAADAESRFLLPNTLYARRMPLGQVAGVRGLKRPGFVDFYQSWYTPGRAVVVAVGDLDARKVERLIRENFADATARRGEQPDPQLGSAPPPSGPVAGFHAEADSTSTLVEVCTVLPASQEPDSASRRRQDLVRGLTNAMLRLRLEKLATSKNAPFQSAGAGFERTFKLAEINRLEASCRPAQWQAALAGLEQELRRAQEFGFSDAEFAHARSIALTAVKSAADQAETRQPAALADEIVGSLAARRVFTSPADDLALVESVLPTLKKQECQAMLRKTWDPRALRIWVHGNLQIAGDAGQQILTVYRASQAIPVRPVQDEQAGRMAFADLGPAGKIVARQQVKDLDFVQATLSNNVRVNVKRTTLEKNVVRVSVRFGGGLKESPADKPGLALMALASFQNGGLKSQSIDQLKQVLADKDLGFGFTITDDAFELGGSCSPALLDTELQLCAAFVKAPGYRAKAADRFFARLDPLYAYFDHSAEGVFTNRVSPFLRSGDPRFSIPPRDALKKLTMKDVESWMAKPLAGGYMEVVIVGDVDPEQALQLTAKTLGALPERAATKPAFAEASKLEFPAAPKLKEFRFESPAPRAISMVCWPTLGSLDIRAERRLGVLRAVLDDRLRIKVRQELGATYTPKVELNSNGAYPDYGYLAASMTVEPKRVGEIGAIVAKIGADLAAATISEDEFERALKPIEASYETLDNNYWVGLLTNCQAYPDCLDHARGRKADLASITKTDIESLAKKYLAAGSATIINVAPK